MMMSMTRVTSALNSYFSGSAAVSAMRSPRALFAIGEAWRRATGLLDTCRRAEAAEQRTRSVTGENTIGEGWQGAVLASDLLLGVCDSYLGLVYMWCGRKRGGS